MKKYDVVVVGGGVIGLSCAFYLSRERLKVAVVERGRAGREASWAAGGILTPIHLADYPAALAGLAALSLRLYPAFARDVREASGVDPELLASGALMALFDSKDERHARRLVAWKKKHDEPAELLSAREAVALEPELSPKVRGALLLPDVRQVRNNRLCRGLVLALRRGGTDILEGTPCLAARGSGVETSHGKLAAGHVVLATGAWAGELTGRLGARADVTPIKGQMVLCQAAPGFLRRIVISKDQYIIPRKDGRLVIGSTVEEVGFDKTTTMDAVAFLAARAAEMCPGVRTLPWVTAWAGLRPGVADRIPYIAPHPKDKRVFVAAGHFRNGILLAPATGKLIASMILAHPPPIDPSPFSF